MELTHTRQLPEPSVKTSLVEVTHILSKNRTLPCRVFFKNEYEQPSGSFKLRGIGHTVRNAVERYQGNVRVFAASGGNAGLAAAYASDFYGVACTVVVPEVCRPHIVAKLQDYGATVVVYGASIEDACVHAQSLMASCTQPTLFCHPFDNPLIWEGHAQMVDEIGSQLKGPVRAIACSVGGGGLYTGIASGLERCGSRAQCLLAETVQAPTLHSSVRRGRVVRLERPETVATSLACSYVSPQTLALFQRRNDKLHMVDDLCAVRACLQFQKDFSVSVEPACGAALSFVYDQAGFLDTLGLDKDDILVVVVCGGSCADEEVFDEYRRMVRQSKM